LLVGSTILASTNAWNTSSCLIAMPKPKAW